MGWSFVVGLTSILQSTDHSSINTSSLGTHAQIQQTIYMLSAEWSTSHSQHSCKKCATLTGGVRVKRSATVSASLDRSANSSLATSYHRQSNKA